MFIGKRKITGRWLAIELTETPWPGWVAGKATVGKEVRLVLTNTLPVLASEELRQAWEWRIEADLFGRCPSCENEAVITPDEDGFITGSFPHESYCPVSNSGLAKLSRQWARGIKASDLK